MHFFLVAGLVIASEIPLPGRDRLDRAAEADVTIRIAPVPARIAGPVQAGPNWTASETELLLSIPSVASFLLVEGKEVEVQPAAGRGPVDAAPFLTQNLLGLLMRQRRRFVLRASAVAINNRALLFCGVSAIGKSTLAAAMAARGHPLLGDDFCTIDWTSDGIATIHGDGAQPMLWADSIEALGLGSAVGSAVREGCGKYQVSGLPVAAGGFPLGGICLLGMDRRIETARIDPVRGLKAANGIRQNVYQPQAPANMAEKLRNFEAGTRIVRQERIFTLDRAIGFDWLEQGLGAMEMASRSASGTPSQ